MNIATTYSINGEFQYEILACLVEYPPVAVVANDWQTASKRLIPPSISKMVSASVNIR